MPRRRDQTGGGELTHQRRLPTVRRAQQSQAMVEVVLVGCLIQLGGERETDRQTERETDRQTDRHLCFGPQHHPNESLLNSRIE